MSDMSEGETAFADTFQFFDIVPEKDVGELRDLLYKYAHNYLEAVEYLQILKQVDAIQSEDKSELLFRIHGMALQCFPLAMRRLTDNISKRSLRKLVTKVVRKELSEQELQKIVEIHEHYSFYLDKGVAHQDEYSIKQILEAFPDSDIIDEDMQHLEDLYNTLVRELCSRYITIKQAAHDYNDELHKLI